VTTREVGYTCVVAVKHELALSLRA
jgi:hypothetical protein